MKKGIYFILVAFIFLLTLLASCDKNTSSETGQNNTEDSTATEVSEKIDIVFLQLNDVYEIDALENGKFGGLARVRTVYDSLKQRFPHTYFFLSGDFLSPSVSNMLKHEGQKIKGRQMVEAMNAAGVDFVTFGNHEFDFDFEVLQQRMNESDFEWIATNTFHKDGETVKPFEKQNTPLPKYKILTVNQDGHRVRIGVLGITTSYNDKEYVHYKDETSTSQEVVSAIKDSCDLLVAMTHFYLHEDREFAKKVPEIRLLMGGHDHHNMLHEEGSVTIAKADANAKTAYIHHFTYNTNTKEFSLKSELLQIDESIPEEAQTAAVTDKWMNIITNSYKESGFDPENVLTVLEEPLDALEKTVRSRQCKAGELVNKAMFSAFKGVDASLVGSGSIRPDDVLSGELTEYDIVRMLPFAGKVVKVALKGRLLKKLLDASEKNINEGGYLQYYKIIRKNGTWGIGNEPIYDDHTYVITTSDYIFSGKETNMGFFKKGHPDIVEYRFPKPGSPATDFRKLVVEYLKANSTVPAAP